MSVPGLSVGGTSEGILGATLDPTAASEADRVLVKKSMGFSHS